METKMSGQLEHFALVTLPGIDPILRIYPCCKYQGALLLVKINKLKCNNNQKTQADVRECTSFLSRNQCLSQKEDHLFS